MRAFLKYAIDHDQPIDPNIFRIAPPRLSDPLPKHLTATEFARLVKTVFADTADEALPAIAARAWFVTLAHTGMRVNELLDLRTGDIDLAAGRITICNPKGGRDRIAYITPTLAYYLQRYLVVRPPTTDDHLWFFAGRLLSDETLRDQLARWGKRCNVKVTPHQLRHTFATQLINHGLPIESVRKLLGHKTPNMTQHYARLYDVTVKQQFGSAAEAMEGIFVKDWPIPVTTSQDTYCSPQVANSV